MREDRTNIYLRRCCDSEWKREGANAAWSLRDRRPCEQCFMFTRDNDRAHGVDGVEDNGRDHFSAHHLTAPPTWACTGSAA